MSLEVIAQSHRQRARAELEHLGGEYPADRTIEHAAAEAAVSISLELARIADALEAWGANGLGVIVNG